MAVNGERIIPPIMDPIPIIAQTPGDKSPGSQGDMSDPSAQPKINKGAKTPPDVPDAKIIEAAKRAERAG